MTHPPRVLMVLNDIAWFWSHRLPLARAIQGRGWTLSLATAGAGSERGLAGMNVQGFDLPDHGKFFAPLVHLSIVARLVSLLRSQNPDLVHAITLRHAFYTALAARICGCKGRVVCTIAGLGSLFTGESAKMKLARTVALPLFRFAFAPCFLIFQNPDDQALMLKAGIATTQNSTVIRGSGVDLAAFPFTPEADTQEPVVLFSSRLIREKGIYDFVEAARILKQQGVRARFAVAGDYYPKNPHSVPPADMEGWAAEGIIDWLGQRDDMPAVLAGCALMVLPSYYAEGVPKTLLEAAATGRAIITTDAPGCREVVSHGRNGLLVPPRNPSALAAAIGELLADSARRRDMGKAGRALAEAEFGVESVVQRTLGVYDRALT